MPRSSLARGLSLRGRAYVAVVSVVLSAVVSLQGADMAMVVLSNVIEVFEDFRYLDEVHGDGTVVLRFAAKVADKFEIEGIDYLTLDADGRVTDLTVFLRPLKAVTAFNELMTGRLTAAPPA